MPDEEAAEAFLRTFSRYDDPRTLDDAALEKRWSEFRQKLTCPAGHNNPNVTNFGDGLTHVSCMERGCDLVWDLEGNLVTEANDEEDV
jgi:hypothetical protein